MIAVLLRAFPYALMTLFLLFLYGINREKKKLSGHDSKYLLLVGYFLLLIFFGLRGFVMTDFVNYYPYFDSIDGIDSIPEIIMSKGWEPGFILYTYLCKSIFPNYFAWNFISCLIDLSLLYVVLKKYSCNHFFSLIVFFVVGGIPLEMNVLRNAKAIFIFLIAIKYIEERRLVPYIAMILLAMTFHVSAVLYIPFYFFIHKKMPKWTLFVVFVFGCIILFGHISILSNIINQIPIDLIGDNRAGYLVAQYLGETNTYGLSLGSIERVITYITLSYIYIRIIPNEDSDIIFYNFYFLLFIVFFYFYESHVIVQRIQYMLIPCFWIVYPSLFKNLRQIGLGRMRYIFIGLLFIKVFLFGSAPEDRYENLLFGIDSYEQRSSVIDFME